MAAFGQEWTFAIAIRPRRLRLSPYHGHVTSFLWNELSAAALALLYGICLGIILTNAIYLLLAVIEAAAGKGAQMKLIAALVMTCALSAVGSVSAQPQPAPPTTPAASPVQSKVDPAQDVRVQALQAEVQILKDFTQHILSTVYFSLGTVVVVLVAMLSFGWYQHIRLAEHEKEALRKNLESALSEGLARGNEEIGKRLQDEVLEVDRKFAEALGLTLRRISELRLFMAADIFRSVHSGKTPRTDLLVLLQVLHGSINQTEPEALKHGLSVLTEHLETITTISSSTRTSLISLANDLPPECSAYAETIRLQLAKVADKA